MDKQRYVSTKIIRGYPVGTCKTRGAWKLILGIVDSDLDFVIKQGALKRRLRSKILKNQQSYELKEKHFNDKPFVHPITGSLFYK